DSSYNVVATVPGGVSATFSRQSDNLAVLSAAGADSVVTFAGTNAPSALSLRGEPRAITSLPDGGFLVLVTTGGGSRVSKITRDGHAGHEPVRVAVADCAAVSESSDRPNLSYDEPARCRESARAFRGPLQLSAPSRRRAADRRDPWVAPVVRRQPQRHRRVRHQDQ